MNIERNNEHDHDLFDLLKQGDEVAFGKIYTLYWIELYNAAYKRLPEKEKCQDIIQNIFTDLWNRKAELDLANPVAYLHTAVRFQVLKHIARSPKNSFFGESFENKLISPLQTDGILLEKEVAELITLFIKALPEKRRKIFVMHYFDGLSTAKIAFELNISQKTVQNQLTVATQALRLRLTHLFLFVSAVIAAIS
ncbi:RNA polymerase sigma-70 factor, ECF subfamily [Pedobacter suwonensis]|uniref:RNA polymerase sigma-70 factor, ECF subfamily n=1 Tax=Pedobacter suwonensis TaxID=332999 RepID=A0A1I0TL35_9SPHI|nr:sigma-70 family RNA polymerase sigma factor [Pedobacter suwonensis]SFA52397.1 RNA polymerase sigma-70 factor, ECF subfamily [Pedobacter suwonensis]